MNDRALSSEAEALVPQDLSDHSDALLDSLFENDPWNAEPSPVTPAQTTPEPALNAHEQLVAPAPSVATAQPPPVNPAGPVRREPFIRSPHAPTASTRKPVVVSRTAGVKVESAPGDVLKSQTHVAGVGLANIVQFSPLPSAVEPSPLHAARISPSPWPLPAKLYPEGLAPAFPKPALSAVEGLSLHGAALDWMDRERTAVERAQWLESEAARCTDTERTGRLMLASSELWAQAGDIEAALRTATLASSLLPDSALAHRQLRQLSLRSGDSDTALAALEVELRHGPDDMRAHLLGLKAALCTHTSPAFFNDALGELARVSPRDPRPGLYRLLEQLAASAEVPAFQNPPETLSPSIARAFEQICRFRTEPTRQDALETSPGEPSLAFERTRRAWRRRDVPVLEQCLRGLALLPGLCSAAQWLDAALCGGAANNQPRALALLRELQAREPSASTERSMGRALVEQNDGPGLGRLLLSADEQAFSALERLSLGAVFLPQSEIPRAWLSLLADTAAGSVARSVTHWAARAVLGIVEAPEHEQDALWKLDLGRFIAAQATWSADQRARLALVAARDPLTLLLELEHARERDDHTQLVKNLVEWSGHEGFASLRVTAALLSEINGENASACALWQEILAQNPGCEVAFRAAQQLGAELGALDLETLARNHQQPERVALLLLESAHGLKASASEQLRLLSSAVERCPTLPFAYQWAHGLSRQLSDPRILLDWLEKYRNALPEPGAWATLAVQAAFQLLNNDRSQATQLIAEVAALFPKDLSLQRLGESLAGPAWGSWRESAVANLESPSERSQLLAELAIACPRTDLVQAVDRLGQALLTHHTELGKMIHRHLADQLARPSWSEQLGRDLAQVHDTEALDEVERLAEIAQWQGDLVLAKECWQLLLTRVPDSLTALRGLEDVQIGTHALSELLASESRLAALLGENEGLAHASFHLLLEQQAGSKPSAPLLDRLLEEDPPKLAALRTALGIAWETKNAPWELDLIRLLLERQSAPEEIASLALRATTLALQLGDLRLADTLLERVLSVVPNHVVALAAQAELFMELERWPNAAQSLSAFAAASHVTTHRAAALYRAALIWMDQLQDMERGEAVLEEAARLQPEDDAIADRLQQHYQDTEQRMKLLELVELRLQSSASAESKERLGQVRLQTLDEVGATPRPRQVTAKVDAVPEHHEALESYARRAMANGEKRAAEGAWLQLVRIVRDPTKQAEYYRGLAELYEQGEANPERAMMCYAEVRKRAPNDVGTAEKLISLYEQLQRGQEAIELQTQLLEGARDDGEKRRWTIRLAWLYESCAQDSKHAELILQQARKTWPRHTEILQALASLYRKSGQTDALNLVLDRANKEARNALASGTLDLAPFEVLRAVAEASADRTALEAILATQEALQGHERQRTGAGAAASGKRVEKFLMPEALSPMLRALLDEAGAALDSVTAQSLPGLQAVPLAEYDAALSDYCRDLARASGLETLELYVSSHLGHEALANNSSPPQVVLGEALVRSGDRPLLTFLLHRALKIIAVHACALVRGTPADSQLRLCALLCALTPDWQPPGIDRSVFEPLSNQIAARLPQDRHEHLASVAREVIDGFGFRIVQAASLVERWVQRTALLATGNVSLALRAVGLPSDPIPSDLGGRLIWIAKNPLARDLVLFSVTDEYFAARRELEAAEPR